MAEKTPSGMANVKKISPTWKACDAYSRQKHVFPLGSIGRLWNLGSLGMTSEGSKLLSGTECVSRTREEFT